MKLEVVTECGPSEINPCLDDSCDGSHCKVCGGHFMDFYGGNGTCSSCETLSQNDKKLVKDAVTTAYKENFEKN